MDTTTLPYRPCVGVMVFNRKGRVWIGRRINGKPEHVDETHAWQMPQGGIDDGEDPREAALRELREETNITSVTEVGESRDWLAYDLPPGVIKKAWRGRFRGQKQKWFALRFDGDESEIDIMTPAGGHKPEFDLWRWEKPERLPGLIIPFKRAVYENVVAEFEPLIKAALTSK